ncbi:DUF4809 family protein [Enterococcus sp. UD-01]|uniref:DUF4809 family protein n=1 Tax=Enterococcus sp. UD-01 TaxID=3373911 RepID=UPI0038361F19
MKQATITKKTNLMDGGCNACGIIEDVNYTMEFEGQLIPIEELTVDELITAIVLNSGFKREYLADAIDDLILYTNETQQVTLKEEYEQLTYSNAAVSMTTNKHFFDKKKMVEMVNELLIKLFAIEAIQFNL